MDNQGSNPRPRLSRRSSMDILRSFTRSVSEPHVDKASHSQRPSSSSPYSIPEAERPVSKLKLASPSMPNRSSSSSTPPDIHLTPPRGSTHTTSSSASTPASVSPSSPVQLYSLPESISALEALLNENMLQQQRLADRVETLNEWLEVDTITLSRFLRDSKKENRALSPTFSDAGRLPIRKVSFRDPETEIQGPEQGSHISSTTLTAKLRSAANKDKKRLSLTDPLSFLSSSSPKPAQGPRPNTETSLKGFTPPKDPALTDPRIQDLRTRVERTKTWKRELERSVVWRREEGWAIRKAMGLPREDGEGPTEDGVWDGGVSAVGDAGVAGDGRGSSSAGWRKPWEKGRGRIPTQREWEELFEGC